MGRSILIFSTSAYSNFAKKITKQAKLQVGRVKIKKFSDGEIYVRVLDNVARKPVYVVGTTAPPADNLVEFVLPVNALKSAAG